MAPIAHFIPSSYYSPLVIINGYIQQLPAFAYLIVGGIDTTGNIIIDSDFNGLVLGDDTDYNIKWNGYNAVHTIVVTAAFEFDGGAIRLPNVTTAQRDALTPANGMSIYNSTDEKFQMYENGSWVQKATVITSAVDLYVKTTGDDSTGTGTDAAPWLTIDRALAVVGTWVLQATVTINIEKGDYTDTDPLVIKHSNGNFLEIVGDSIEETLTLIDSAGGAPNYWYKFATTNTDAYTVGDYILNYSVSGGTNPNSTLGVLECTSKDSGVSITLTSKISGVSRAFGSVIANLVTPQVQWIRLITIKSSLANLEGIQQQYDAAANWDRMLYVDATDAVAVYVNKYVCVNINDTKYGACRNYPSSFVKLTKFGVRNLYVGWMVDDVTWIYSCVMNANTFGLRVYGGGTGMYNTICLVENATALRAELMSLCHKGGGTRVFVGAGNAVSPALGAGGNQNSWMGE